MNWKSCFNVLGLLVFIGLMSIVSAEAATRAIPGITNAALQMADTIKTIGVLVAPVLIVCAVYEARQHAGFGVMFSLIGVILVVGIILFADEIVQTIKPGVALGFAGGIDPTKLSLQATWAVVQQLLLVSGLTEGIRRVRRP